MSGHWHETTDAQQRALTVIMEATTPATLSQVQRGAKCTLFVVAALERKGLIVGDPVTGYRATPDGVTSFCGVMEVQSQIDRYPNGGVPPKTTPRKPDKQDRLFE